MPIIGSIISGIVGKLMDWLPTIAAFFAGKSAQKKQDELNALQDVAEIKEAEAEVIINQPKTKDEVIKAIADM